MANLVYLWPPLFHLFLQFRIPAIHNNRNSHNYLPCSDTFSNSKRDKLESSWTSGQFPPPLTIMSSLRLVGEAYIGNVKKLLARDRASYSGKIEVKVMLTVGEDCRAERILKTFSGLWQLAVAVESSRRSA